MRLILCEAGKFGGMLRLMLEERKYLPIFRGIYDRCFDDDGGNGDR